MASGITSRLLANVLSKVRRDKEERIKEDFLAQEKALIEEEERKKAELEALKKKRAELDEREALEKESLELLERDIKMAEERAFEEQKVSALQARMHELRGNDDASLRERLISEGFAESLTEQQLRLRTIDQKIGNEMGMRARFSRFGEEDPSNLLTTDANPFYRSSVFDEEMRRLENLGVPDRAYIRNVEMETPYQSNNFSSQQERLDEWGRKDSEDGVKKGLGLGLQNNYNR